MKNSSLKISIPVAALSALLLSGCYTQLYTGAYIDRDYERAQNRHRLDDRRAAPESGSPDYRSQSDAAQAKADSQASSSAQDYARESDTLAPKDSSRQTNVIVNNYYEEGPVYRGYAASEWEYPFISFGFYSSRYRDFYGPYWWNDGYIRDHYRCDYYSPYHDRYYSYPSGGRGSDHPKSIFAPPPSIPRVQKGRRANPSAAQPAQSQAQPKASSGSSSSSGSSGGSSSNSSSSSSNDNGSAKSGDNSSSNKQDDGIPAVQKGRRR